MERFKFRFKTWLILILAVSGLGLVLALSLVTNLAEVKPEETVSRRIRFQDKENELVVNENGLAEIKNGDSHFFQDWDKREIDDLFSSFGYRTRGAANDGGFKDLLVESVGDDYRLTYLLSDGTTAVISAEESGLDISSAVDKAGSLAESGGTSGYFDFSSPAPSSSSQSSTGGSSSSGAAGGRLPDCPFWRISYCVYPQPTPPPAQAAASPSPSPVPGQAGGNSYQGVVQKEPDCSLWDYQLANRGVVSNTLCVVQEAEQ